MNDATKQQASPTPASTSAPTAFEIAQFQRAFDTYGSSLSLYVQLTVAGSVEGNRC